MGLLGLFVVIHPKQLKNSSLRHESRCERLVTLDVDMTLNPGTRGPNALGVSRTRDRNRLKSGLDQKLSFLVLVELI